MPLTQTQRDAFERDGFFVIRNFANASVGAEIEREIIAAIRNDPPANHPGAPAYQTAGELFIQPEQKPNPHAKAAEDHISKVFNPHLSGAAAAFADSADVADIVSDLLGEPASVFQSQFIFKNPGAWGQPWHQDSYYFPFDRRPEIGVWLAISEATLENGCLAAIPGAHKSEVLEHGPDKRPGANYGYTEISGLPEEKAVPLLMEPGDCLFFHSLLPHRSYDNRAATRRAAIVYHYAATATKMATEPSLAQKAILRWRPVGRAA
jgi:ectoine hydroxylase-related dioxygenase (phytanoyl-CoA dioxygenase family)